MVTPSDSAGMNADRAHAQEHPNALPHDGNGTPNTDCAHAQEPPKALPHDDNGTPNADCAHAQKQPAGPKE